MIFAWIPWIEFIRFILALFLLPSDFYALRNLGVLLYPEIPLDFVRVYKLS